MSIRILIADDHGVLRAGLRALLSAESDLEVAGEAADGREALHLVSDLNPDVVLLDVNMPGPDGIEVTRRLKAVKPEVRVLILTVHEDEGLLREAIRAGASGYILKRAVESELIYAIHAVWRRPARPGGRVLVLGCGTIGFLTIQSVRVLQPESQVTAVAQFPWQAKMARRYGAQPAQLPGSGWASQARAWRAHASPQPPP